MTKSTHEWQQPIVYRVGFMPVKTVTTPTLDNKGREIVTKDAWGGCPPPNTGSGYGEGRIPTLVTPKWVPHTIYTLIGGRRGATRGLT